MLFAHIDSLRVYRLSGQDAETFLQGQLTSDIAQLDQHWQLSGYCNPKGRLLGLLYLARINGEFIAIVESSLADSVMQRLKMYVLRSKVVIQEIENARLIGLMHSGGELGTVSAWHDLPCLDFGFGRLMLELSGESVQPAELRDTEAATAEHWWSALIRAGIPTITKETQELFVPQMVNLDLLGGISFKKGCYTGQEIVARMHYLGKLKQRLFVCRSEAGAGAAAVGTKIISAQSANAGTLISPFLDGCSQAVIRLEHIGDTLSLEDGSPLTLLEPQPYSIDPKKDG